MTLRTRRARHGGSWQKPQHLGDGHRRTRASRSFLIFDYIAVPKPLSKNRIRHKITSCPRLKSAGNSLIPSQGRGVSRAPWSCFPTFSVLITRHSDFGVQSPEPFVVTLSILPPSFPRSALLFPVLFPPPLLHLCMPSWVFLHHFSHLFCVGQRPTSAVVPQELLTLSFETVSLWDPELSHCTKLSGQQAHQAVGSDLGL